MLYRNDIDGLRAIAVLAVLVGHIFPNILPNGYIGVDIFFVISDYLITRIIYDEHRAGTFSLIQFYERRVRRIMPALLVVCAASLVAAWCLFLPDEMKAFGKSLSATMVFGSNFVFRAESGYFDMENMLKPLLHTWSLAVEEQFYIIFPLFVGWVMHRQMRLSLRSIVLIVAALSLALNMAFVMTGDYEASFFFFPMRAWELLVGAWIALYHADGGKIIYPRVASWLGFALLIAGLVVSIPEDQFPGFYALLPTLGAGLLIYAGQGDQANLWVNRVFLSNLPMQWIGKISYSLYLWHWPLLIFVSYYALGSPGIITKIGVMAASFIMAFLSWRFVERSFRSRTFMTRRGVFMTMGIVGVVLALCGVGLMASKGARFKFDSAILALNDTDVSGNYEQWTQGPVETSFIINPDVDAPAPSIVVWGDSHASAIGPAIGAITEKRRINGAVIEGNSCFLLPSDAARVKDSGDCGTLTQKTLDFIIADNAIHTVVLANRWAEHLKFWYKHSMTREDAIALRLRSLTQITDTLSKAGKKVVLFAQVPQIITGNEDIASMVARITLYGMDHDLRPTVAQYQEQQTDMMAIYNALEAGGHVTVIWPDRILCSQTYCNVTDAGGVLYYDDDHLSQYGARKMAVLFDGVIKR